MAKNTEISLRNKVIYSVYVRNHTNDGTFNAVADDLDRIKSLGTDIIWFCLLYTSPSPRDLSTSRMPSSA